MVINHEKIHSSDSSKKIEHAFILIFLIIVFAAEIYRIVKWDFTWDESITYTQFVKPILYDQNLNASKVIEFFLERTGHWCAMNNHLLNTFAMIAASKFFYPFFGYENEIVLRLPVFASFCLYLCGILFMYRKKRITWLGVFLLCGSRYMMDFFALSRGYAIAASCILFTCICIVEWENNPEKEWLVILGISFVTLGIVAQTVTFIIAAPIYLWLLIRIIQRKMFLRFIRLRHLVIILILAAINVLMLVFHFTVSAADHCLAPNGDMSLRSVMMNIFVGGEKNMYFYIFTIVFYAFLAGGWILFCQKKITWDKMCFSFIFTIYVIIMSVVINTVRLGLPVSRMLLPAFPVMALAVHNSIVGISENMPVERAKAPAAICVLVVASIWCKQYDLSLSREWPCCQGIKGMCYEALENGAKVYPPEDDALRSESWTFYRYQIYSLTGYDIIE